MNYKAFILFLTPFLFSCHNKHTTSPNLGDVHIDSIVYYYDVSKDKAQTIDSRQEAIDKAYQQVVAQQNDTLYVKVLYRKSVLHYSQKQYDSLTYYNDLLLAKAKESGDLYYTGKANYLKAYYLHAIQYSLDSSFYYYNKSKNNFLSIPDSSQVGRRLLNMAHIQQNCSDYFGSKETTTEALQYLDKQKDTNYIASAYNVLAMNNLKLLNDKDATLFYKKAIEITKDQKNLLVYKNNLGTVYIGTQEYQKAIELFKGILKDSLINKIPKQRARVLDNLAYARWRKDTLDVRNDFLKALEIRTKHNDKSGLIASYTRLGEFFLQKDSNEAISWFQKAIRISKRVKNPKGELDALQFLMRIQPNDIGIKNRYITLSDSLKKQELQVKTQFAKIRYDDRLKSEEIENLKVIMAKQRLEVSIQRTQKIIYLLAGIILLLAIAFFRYYLVQKHRKEKEIEVYETEKRISKRIHDELANDISHLTSFVEKTEDIPIVSTKELLGNKLQNIYLRARDISIETATIDIDDFEGELINLIQQYNTSDVSVITNVSEFEWTTIPDYKKIAVYRVLQELFINAKKHSHCKRITLMVKDSDKKRVIKYIDNGKGCNISTIKTNGLVNAENRIENIKGKLTFETSPEQGFRATIVFQK
ncbi:tetratricopeptide repeat-containing sensor histidine kinase [Aquimarina megaterium]|uniref:tetratricopeptide repeat-containing sensor histidine kinase n=1 Tax=Aquimarina megaterium TaxID=1443666 RepID=UPI001111D3F2|nr:tetratricopeptide repeat-containing sensor histidine kinase [Aquimarina megaterium]